MKTIPMNTALWLCLAPILLSACTPGGAPPTDDAQDVPGETDRAASDMSSAVGSDGNPVDDHAQDTVDIAARDLILREWRRAQNRTTCAPIGFANDSGAGGLARRANFSGGWAVAFDLPDRRSAYGVAGAGIASPTAAELSSQWPYTYVPEMLPEPSIAGYGLEGGAPYSDEAPDGFGMQSLAYVTVAGQDCLYNVWSKLGRAHLEVLIDSLRVIEP